MVDRFLNDRQASMVDELNDDIKSLADALDRRDLDEASKFCRAVEISAMALRLMLTGGRG